MGMIQGAVLGAAGSVAAAQANIKAAGELKAQEEERKQRKEAEAVDLKLEHSSLQKESDIALKEQFMAQTAFNEASAKSAKSSAKVEEMENKIAGLDPKKDADKIKKNQKILNIRRFDAQRMNMARKRAEITLDTQKLQYSDLFARRTAVADKYKILTGQRMPGATAETLLHYAAKPVVEKEPDYVRETIKAAAKKENK